MEKSNVAYLPSHTRAISVGIDKLDGPAGVKLIARLIRQQERSGITYKALAKQANLYPQTVARIASEDTKAPRLHTILMIMKALGFQMVKFE